MTQFNKTGNFLIPVGKQNVKAAAFIAHPDDETIWMGGTLLANKDWEWKIFVNTYGESDNRGKEFISAINKYKYQYGVTNLEVQFTEIMPDTQDSNRLMENEINHRLDLIKLSSFDIIFTHNIDGEYNGAPNHKILGEYFQSKKLNIWHFLYPAIQNPREKQVGQYIETVRLSPTVLKQKYLIFQYSHFSQHYLWTGFEDFMTFEFQSGIEMFTRYSND